MQYIGKVRLIAILALALGLMVSAVSAQDAIAVGDSVEATAEDANVDYTLSLEAGQAVQIYLLTDDFSSLLELRDPAGELVASDEDSGDDFNDARIIFVAPESGDYRLTVASSFGEPEGAYTLSVAEETVPMIAYGESITTDGAGMIRFYFQITATAGDVLNVFAETVSDDDDIDITIRDMMGEELERDDDDGVGNFPYIRRIEIPADGVYNLFVERIFDREMVGAFEIFVEQTEALPVTAEPFVVTLGEVFDVEVFSFDAASGTDYRLTITADANEVDTTVDVLPAGQDWADIRFTASDYSEISFVFTARATGPTRIVVDNTTWDEEIDYTVSLEIVE
jgi:hypothetical protein